MATRRLFSREFKVEAVNLVKDRGVSVSQASRDLDLNESVLGRWTKELAQEEQDAFPSGGNMKHEQAEIARLKKEVAKLKMERDLLKKPQPTSRRNRCEIRLHRETPRGLANELDVRGTPGVTQRILCVVDVTTQHAKPGK